MLEGLRPYPEMKDSGLDWLGDVPRHWSVRRIKNLFREKDERSGKPSGALLSLTRTRGILPQAEASKRIASVEDLSKYKVCEPGELVMNRMQAWSGMFAMSPISGLISPDYAIFQPSADLNVKFFESLFRTPVMVAQFAGRSQGIGSGFNRLYTEDFGAIPAAVPPVNEQAAIVRFLDHADRRIRRYIAAKRKLVALLNEQKQAIIQRAVTRGLDPNVRLKFSGVDWLGEVPEHWAVTALRRVTRARCDGPFGSGLKSTHYVESGVRVIRLTNIGHGVFKGSNRAFISEDYYATLGDHGVLPGDLLVAGLGDNQLPPGRACVAPAHIQPAMVKADCFRFRLDASKVDPEFIALQLTATASGAASESRGATRQRVNLQSMAGRRIAAPPLSEQREIVSRCRLATNSIDVALAAIDGELELIRAYRVCLVSDVVTGKLDVREAAAHLVDEPDDAIPVEELAPGEDENLDEPDLEEEAVG